jgi:cellulose biosynthesis protein BcsQ
MRYCGVSSPPDTDAPARLVVFASCEAGAGATTLAFQTAMALSLRGGAVRTVDLDAGSTALSGMIEQRTRWSRLTGLELTMPNHTMLTAESATGAVPPPAREDDGDGRAIVIADVGPDGGALASILAASADMLIMPVRATRKGGWPEALDDFAGRIREARRARHAGQGGFLDWLAVPVVSDGVSFDGRSLRHAGLSYGFRCFGPIPARVEYGALGAAGLAVTDSLPGRRERGRPTLRQLAARREIEMLADLVGGSHRAHAASIAGTVTMTLARPRLPHPPVAG